jgi:hypothetical protein
MFQDFLGRVFFSGRFWIGMIVFFIINYAGFRQMTPNLEAMNFHVNVVELTTIYMSSVVPAILYYAVLIFQISAFPAWEGSQNAILRLGKKWWLIEQFFHGLLVAVFQYAVLTISIILPLFPCIQWNNQWSDFMKVAQGDLLTVMQTGLNISLDFEKYITELGTPWSVYGICFVLTVLCSLFISMLVTVLHLGKNRGIGTAIALVIASSRILTDSINVAVFSTAVRKVLNTLIYGLMPMSQNNLNTLTQMKGYTKAFSTSGRIGFALGYFLILIVIIGVLGNRHIRNVDLTSG